MRKITKIIALFLLIIVLGGFSGIMADRFLMPWLSSKKSLNKWAFFKKANENVTVINKTEQVIVREDLSVAKIAENILPSVVKIISYRDIVNADKKIEGFKDLKSSEDIGERVKTGLIITNDGLIMSVNKKEDQPIVEPKTALKYKIIFSDNRESDAELVLSDEFSELEFFKVKQENLVTPTFGNSTELESGEKVIAIGNTGGEYQNNFTSGVVSEVDRTFTLLNSQLSSSEKMEGAILSDVNIDGKNAGGPVLDFNGNLIGIANFILKDGKTEGFIMPINKLKSTIDKAVKGEEIKRPKLGVYYLSVDKEIALLSDLSVSKGALVYSFSGQQGLAVKQGSAADLAGIKIGDIILAVNDVEITMEKSLANLVSEFSPGEKIKLKVLRNEKEVELEAVLE